MMMMMMMISECLTARYNAPTMDQPAAVCAVCLYAFSFFVGFFCYCLAQELISYRYSSCCCSSCWGDVF